MSESQYKQDKKQKGRVSDPDGPDRELDAAPRSDDVIIAQGKGSPTRNITRRVSSEAGTRTPERKEATSDDEKQTGSDSKEKKKDQSKESTPKTIKSII